MKSCLLGDAGIAIALTSLPFRQEVDFYDGEFADALFPNYKKAIVRNFSSKNTTGQIDTEFKDLLYEPVPYYLFGSFDLAVITLIDDFEMMARTFRPFDPMLSHEKDKRYREEFFYKVITGPTPQFKPGDSMVKIAADTFLKEDRAPLLAMSLLKVNNALLLGSGTEFLRPVVRYIHAKARAEEQNNPKMKHILLESYSANEITLLVFTDSYSAAAKLITSVRESRLRDLVQLGDKVATAEESEALLNNCMLRDLNKDNIESVLDSTLFIDTESYFGFDFRLLRPGHEAILERIDENDATDLFCQWSIRPGHLQNSIKELTVEKGQLTTCAGRGDLFEQATELTTREMIQQVLATLKSDGRPEHARRRQTMPAMGPKVMNQLPLKEEWDIKYVEPALKPLSFTVEEIGLIQDRLREMWTPKILTGKVLNAFTNFNDGILDPALYGYFIELLPLMKLIQQKVEDWHSTPKLTTLRWICATLEKVTDNFERAYRNRFYNSYRMGDITDFNLDFKGGIQQLITSFDAAYKAICSELGGKGSFVYVAGSPGVYSTRWEVRLNYYHVFQPEIFASIANHEAANFYFTRYRAHKAPWFAAATELVVAQDPSEDDERQGSILRSLDGLRSVKDGDQQKLLPYIKSRLFKNIFVDLLALYFAYNRNYSLFAYWYWGHFAQTSDAYSQARELDQTEFVSFMLRMRWIERIAGVESGEPLRFGREAFDSAYSEFQSVCDSFLDWLWDHAELDKWNYKVVKYVESKFIDVHHTSEDETVQQITERLEKEASAKRTMLENGETCMYSRVDDKSTFRFTEQIFYAYLSLLKTRFGAGEILLNRQDKGRPETRPTSARALFDPVGGIFTHDAETRRLRFRYRAAFTMSLWDMAQKEKKRAVLERLNGTIPREIVEKSKSF